MTTTTPTTTPNTHHLHHQRHSAALKDWREVDALRLLNLHYDITPAHFLTVICCDIGVIAPTSVVTVMRDIESRQQQQQR